MQVLHDWDNPSINIKWVLKRGLSLISYYLSRKFPALLKLRHFDDNSRMVEEEQIEHMETLIMLDELCGVTPIFGIRDVIMERYEEELGVLAIKYHVDIRRHVHIGESPDPERRRLWDPPLSQSETTWSFDRDYINGMKYILKKDELPIWHVDKPHYLPFYIRYLYEELTGDKR